MTNSIKVAEVLATLDDEYFDNYEKRSYCFVAGCAAWPTIHVLAKSRTYACWVCEFHFKELSFIEVKEGDD